MGSVRAAGPSTEKTPQLKNNSIYYLVEN